MPAPFPGRRRNGWRPACIRYSNLAIIRRGCHRNPLKSFIRHCSDHGMWGMSAAMQTVETSSLDFASSSSLSARLSLNLIASCCNRTMASSLAARASLSLPNSSWSPTSSSAAASVSCAYSAWASSWSWTNRSAATDASCACDDPASSWLCKSTLPAADCSCACVAWHASWL